MSQARLRRREAATHHFWEQFGAVTNATLGVLFGSLVFVLLLASLTFLFSENLRALFSACPHGLASAPP